MKLGLFSLAAFGLLADVSAAAAKPQKGQTKDAQSFDFVSLKPLESNHFRCCI